MTDLTPTGNRCPQDSTDDFSAPVSSGGRKGRIQQYLEEDPDTAALYRKFHTHASPIISTNYDITQACNLRCEGCLFFEGTDYLSHTDDKTLEDYDAFFQKEAERGVTFPYFAGGEPALEQDRLRVAKKHFKRGLIFSNGTIPIDPEIEFSVHVSIWGDEVTTKKFRGGSVFRNSLMNYVGDKRATFIYTVNHQNIDSIPAVVSISQDHGVRISFNHFSATEQYDRKIERGAKNDDDYFRFSNKDDNLRLTVDDRSRARDVIDEMIDDYPDTVIYSHYYNKWISQPQGLYKIDPETGWAMDCPTRNASFHQHYNVDLTESNGKCCSPNINCRDCRAYAIAFATFRHRVRQFLRSGEDFAEWMRCIDTWCRMHLIGWDDIK